MFYSGDWLKEPTLRMCSLAARGAWIDLLMFMHAGDDFKITATLLDYARILGTDFDEALTVLCELIGKNVCDASVTAEALRVTPHNAEVTLISRRFQRDRKSSNANAERQERYRKRHAK